MIQKQFTSNRKELADKYFPALGEFYERGNMGIISLLSDVQEHLSRKAEDPYWNQVLNDIKCVLVSEQQNVRQVCRNTTYPIQSTQPEKQ